MRQTWHSTPYLRQAPVGRADGAAFAARLESEGQEGAAVPRFAAPAHIDEDGVEPHVAQVANGPVPAPVFDAGGLVEPQSAEFAVAGGQRADVGVGDEAVGDSGQLDRFGPARALLGLLGAEEDVRGRGEGLVGTLRVALLQGYLHDPGDLGEVDCVANLPGAADGTLGGTGPDLGHEVADEPGEQAGLGLAVGLGEDVGEVGTGRGKQGGESAGGIPLAVVPLVEDSCALARLDQGGVPGVLGEPDGEALHASELKPAGFEAPCAAVGLVPQQADPEGLRKVGWETVAGDELAAVADELDEGRFLRGGHVEGVRQHGEGVVGQQAGFHVGRAEDGEVDTRQAQGVGGDVKVLQAHADLRQVGRSGEGRAEQGDGGAGVLGGSSVVAAAAQEGGECECRRRRDGRAREGRRGCEARSPQGAWLRALAWV